VVLFVEPTNDLCSIDDTSYQFKDVHQIMITEIIDEPDAAEDAVVGHGSGFK
jgi:hypothetical protein